MQKRHIVTDAFKRLVIRIPFILQHSFAAEAGK
jgi:hypothetical protein